MELNRIWMILDTESKRVFYLQTGSDWSASVLNPCCWPRGSNVPNLLFSDRPWLTDVPKVQKLQEKVYVALQRCLQNKGASEEKLAKVRQLLPLLQRQAVVFTKLDVFLLRRWSPSCPWWGPFATSTLTNWSFSAWSTLTPPTASPPCTGRFSAARSPFQTPRRASAALGCDWSGNF